MIVGFDVLEIVFVVAPADTAVAGRSFSRFGHQLNIYIFTISSQLISCVLSLTLFSWLASISASYESLNRKGLIKLAV